MPMNVRLESKSSEIVKAMADGTVIDTGMISHINGKQVIIQHNNNMISIYKNLDKVNVGIGVQVKNNSNIGNAKPEKSFIDISVFLDGNAVNPEIFWK